MAAASLLPIAALCLLLTLLATHAGGEGSCDTPPPPATHGLALLQFHSRVAAVSNPTAPEAVLNLGKSCWSPCGRSGGLCHWCGTGACCRPKFKRDPEVCSTAHFTKTRRGHRCVSLSTPAPVPPPTALATNWVKTDKLHYAMGERIIITFARNQSGWKRWNDKIEVYSAFRVTGDMIPTTEHEFNMMKRFSKKMSVSSCGTKSCKGHAASGSMEFGPDRVHFKGHGYKTWPLQSGCYKLALTSWEQRPHPTKRNKKTWRRFIAALSEHFPA